MRNVALEHRRVRYRRQKSTSGPPEYAMSLDLVPLWAGILALAVFMYVLLDGFDLGVGILSAFAPDEPSRDLMMDSVAPIWDGNETWLVFGGVALYSAFPLAFAIERISD